MREDSATEPEKKREVLLKILYPHRFGKAKLGLKGGRRHRLQPQRVQGDMDDGDDDDDFMDMPRFAVQHEGWLATKVGRGLPPTLSPQRHDQPEPQPAT